MNKKAELAFIESYVLRLDESLFTLKDFLVE